MLFDSHRNDYVDNDGPVRYLDGSGLDRPLDMPRKQIAVMAAFVLVAAVIGGFLVFNVLDAVQGSAARSKASVEENLSRDVSYDLPNLASLAALGDDDIKQNFADAGFTTYDNSKEGEYPEGGFELIKLPSDVPLDDAAVLYAQGVSNLTAADAALLLNGSWTITVDRENSLDLRLRYADFSSGSVDAAIQHAMDAEGFDAATVPEEDGSGVDESGNTFKTGTLDVDGTTYTWRVSAIALSSVFDISGLPESAVYVGIHLTA